MYTGSGPFGEASGNRCRWRWSRSRRSRNGRPEKVSAVGADPPSRVNLLNWDGKGSPDGMFTPARVARSVDTGQPA